MLPRLPLDYIGISQSFSSKHPAIDLGWHNYEGESIYSAFDGEVILNGTYSDAGHMIIIADYKKNQTILSRYLHLKEKSDLKVGSKVRQGDIIGKMGNTGLSTGTHLHFEYWICPKDYKYKFSDIYKYSLNPIKYCYLYPNMEANKNDISSLLKVVGNPVSKNDSINQIEVKINYLNCREEPNGKILGYTNMGIYNVLDEKEQGDYKWYQIETSKWIAYDEKWANLFLVDNCEEIIKKLSEENKVLKDKLERIEKIIKE